MPTLRLSLVDLHARFLATALAFAAGGALLLPEPADASRRRGGGAPLEAQGFALFTSPQANPIALSADGTELYVANTTSNTVDVISTASNTVTSTVRVGIDPVAVAPRPGSSEVWVSNHVSDSVSVIDTSLVPPEVSQTVQDIGGDRVTDFDEPVGIAFNAAGTKAYVALSSRNEIAVVDTSTYSVTNRLSISAQDPRALTVANGLLYVAAFESGNQSELAACLSTDPQGFDQCSLDDNDLAAFAQDPNLPGLDKNIVIDTDLPDRDLFVFDTNDDSAVDTVTGIGTLLYGVAADSSGTAYLSLTNARNDANGRTCNTVNNATCNSAGGDSDVNGDNDVNLQDLQNRIFENLIAEVSCTAGGGCGSVTLTDLEPSLPATADDAAQDGSELATPYGIRVSGDGSTLVVTAAASSRIFTFDTGTSSVLDRLDVGAIPRGVALLSDGGGAPDTAYVLNTLGNTVSVVDVSNPSNISSNATINVGSDPTENDVRLGRIAFNDATASDSGTFACASCHPDGNTDQLLWRIGGECFLSGCVADEDETRSTMPVRGLKNTNPLHWDGTLGDPFGGPNGSGTSGSNCTDDQSCFRQLSDASLSGVMCAQQGGCANGPSGLPGRLTATERDNMATFLQTVSYPPARSRPVDDVVTSTALDGFSDFFVDHGGQGNILQITTCADFGSGCHSLPLGASDCDGTEPDPGGCVVGSFDAPTMRGMTDRFLQFSLGTTNPHEILVASLAGLPGAGCSSKSWNPATEPLDELLVFAAAFPSVFEPVYNVCPDDIFQMFEEASTGYSGAIARQVTLNTTTAAGCPSCEAETILAELEAADVRGVVNLRGEGRRNANTNFQIEWRNGSYRTGGGATFTRAALVSDALAGNALITFTAELRDSVGDLISLPQPVLAPTGGLFDGAIENVSAGASLVTLTGIDVSENAEVFVDGVHRTDGFVNCLGGVTGDGFCNAGTNFNVNFGTGGFATGLHLVQVQNPKGLLSNEMPVCAGGGNNCD